MSTDTTPSPEKPDKSSEKGKHFDPDTFRMTVGEHLEELRTRLVLALVGFAIATLACLLKIQAVLVFFCKPLTDQLVKHKLNPQTNYTDLTGPFMTYLKVTLIVAAAIAGPWMIYQVWQFVAAGLYPKERKTVTRYIPLSIGLFLFGLIFVYYLVLPLSIRFFIEFSNIIPLPPGIENTKVDDRFPPLKIPYLDGNPPHPVPGDMWFDGGRLKFVMRGDDDKPEHYQTRIIQINSQNLLSPNIQFSDYIDLVIMFMLTFGLAFQLPLVLLAVVSTGIVDVPWLRKQRRMVYFVMAVVSAFIAPGDIVTTMLALLIPLILLYEFGLWLAIFAARRKAREAAAEEAAGDGD